MPIDSSPATVPPAARRERESKGGERIAWIQVTLAALLMVATLPGRTQGLGLITEPLLGDLHLDRVAYANINLWATLIGSAFCRGSIALFGLVSSGLGLFNEAVLAERGFDQKTYHTFLAVTTLVALAGQFLCGWCCQRWSMQRLLGAAMFLYATGLGALPLLRTLPQLWMFAADFGLSGGMITVLFFAGGGQAFGRAHLGRIQGAAQMLTVFASAMGPLFFAECHERFASYAPLLLSHAPLVLLFGAAAWNTRMQPFLNETARAAGER